MRHGRSFTQSAWGMQEAAFDDRLEHSMLAVWAASNPALQGESRICVAANQVFPAFVINFEAT